MTSSPPTQNSANDRQSPPALANTYAPSVPISVYRELAAEMQANQAMLEFLTAQNQQLVQQNQQLRQEIEKLAQSAVYLQQLANSFEPQVQYKLPQQVKTELAPAIAPRPESPPPAPATPPEPSELSEELFTEQQESRDRRPSPPERASESGGGWLIVAIVLIIVCAGTAGFLVIRSFTK